MGLSLVKHVVSQPIPAAFAQQEPTPDETSPAGPANCNVIGNNTATAKLEGSEAQKTLMLLPRNPSEENINNVVAAITLGKEVLIRLGAGEGGRAETVAAAQQEAATYAIALQKIRARTGNTPFIVTAGRNEPNCAEDVPFDSEVAFVQTIIAQGPQGNVTYITGQIDYLCGDFEKRGDQPPSTYISTLSAIPGVSGVALPFYTGDAGSKEEMLTLFAGAASAANGKPIYITESGPYKRGSASPSDEEFLEYAQAVQEVLARGNVQGLYLFNALGRNPESSGNFKYTERFWNPACREAFRTSCNNPEQVAEVCGGNVNAGRYVEELLGLVEKDSGLFLNDLIDQGYQVLCSPKASIITEQGGFFEDVAPGSVQLNVGSEYRADYTQSDVPLFRQGEGLFASIEGNFGFRNPEENTTSDRDPVLHTASLFRMTSLSQQCQIQKRMLETVEAKCQKLEDPSTCTLYQTVPGTTQTYETLYQQTKDLSCNQLLGFAPPPAGVSNLDLEQLKNDLAHVPPYIKGLYRLAFIVVTTENKPDTTSGLLRFFRSIGKDSASARHTVRVVSILVPDVAMNRDPNDADTYQDGTQLTSQALEPFEVQQKRKENEVKSKTEFKQTIESGEYLNTQILPIDCGGSQCGDPLVQGLVTLINANGVSCQAGAQDLPFEGADTIKVPAGITVKDDQKFKGGGLSLLEVLGSSQLLENPLIQFLAGVSINDQKSDAESQVVTYLVLPQGEGLEHIENTLMGLVETPESRLAVLDAIDRYFALEGGSPVFTSDRPQVNVGAAPTTPPAEGETPNPDDELPTGNRTAEAFSKIADDPTPEELAPRLHGGIFSNVYRRSLRALTAPFQSPEEEYFDSCKSLEDFYLGKCTTDKSQATGDIKPNVSSAACPFVDQTTELIPKDDVQRIICQEAKQHNVPGFMLRGIFDIEGFKADDVYSDGGSNEFSIGDKIACVGNTKGAVGPMQIKVDSCKEGGPTEPYTGKMDICSLPGALDAAAQNLRSKANYVSTLPEFVGLDWDDLPDGSAQQYRFLYLMGGYYNGEPACVIQPEKGCAVNRGACDLTSGWTYCGYTVKAYNTDAYWRCDGDPVIPDTVSGYTR